MSRRSRGNQCSSNGSISAEGTSSSKRGEEKTLSGRCFCGQGVVLLQSGTLTNPGRWFVRCPLWKTMDCKYFIWVDEIDGGWEGLARALVRKNQDSSCGNHEVNLTGQRREIQENSVKILLKIGKLQGEIRIIRSWIITIFLSLLICVGLNLLQLINM
ncbi:uncharacterized protein LOC110271177 [Arachis ipaensis]|uniref:uncharacterized protein LOC110271177 n=1 Tax=Arachis ipaensis TaxID=130454 RepID=UPI000A2B027D|nr:uncharacterized protein LOC110271177 [Arachis ipaensis]